MKLPQPTCSTCRFWDVNTQRIGTYRGGKVLELRSCIESAISVSRVATDYCGRHPNFVTANPESHTDGSREAK